MNSPILIYGFGPFEHYASNISEEILAIFPKSEEIKTIVFKVCFDRKMFLEKLDRHKPKLIIGLGQHSRARKIRIERIAHNWMTPHRQPPGYTIDRSKRLVRYANLDLPVDHSTTLTYDAGTYVCNYSMWIVAQWCERNDAQWGFLHLPIQIKKGVVIRYLQEACRKAQKQRTFLSQR